MGFVDRFGVKLRYNCEFGMGLLGFWLGVGCVGLVCVVSFRVVL